MPLFIIHEEIRAKHSQYSSAHTFVVAADTFEGAVSKLTARYADHALDSSKMNRTIRAMQVEGDIAGYDEIQAEHEPFLALFHGDTGADRKLGYYCPACKETRTERRQREATERLARRKVQKTKS
jgi:hypothetical protein